MPLAQAESDPRFILQARIRAIENRYRAIHEQLLDWGRWGRGWDEDKPRTAPSGIWTMPAEGDPDGYAETASRDSVAPPIDEKAVEELDERVNDRDFPAIWRRVLVINYVGVRTYRGYVLLPEWQRPAQVFRETKAKGGRESFYCEQLGLVLENLGCSR